MTKRIPQENNQYPKKGSESLGEKMNTMLSSGRGKSGSSPGKAKGSARCGGADERVKN